MEYTFTGTLRFEVPSVRNDEGYPLQVEMPFMDVTSEDVRSGIFAETIDQDVADAVTVIQRKN